MTKNIIKSILFAGGAFFATACSDFLDINTDPNNPTRVPSAQLLTGASYAVGMNFGAILGGFGNTASTFTHQILARNDQYSIDGSTISNPWVAVFTTGLVDLEIIIKQSEEAGDYKYVGVAKILKAYTFSMLVDVFGDLPFDEAVKGAENTAPVYQDDKEIYAKCIALLDEGKADLAKVGGLVPGADDVFYSGNVNSWRRFANTVKLKMYNQMRKVEDVKDEINALITENDLIGPTEGFELPFGTSVQPSNRHPAFMSDWAASGRESWVSIWFYNIMIGRNANIFSGLVDPRVPYYFYNQKTNATPEPGAIYQDGRFISRPFGFTSAGTAMQHAQTLIGLYPVGGRYDDGVGGLGISTSGGGNVSQRLLPYFSRKFIEAEFFLEEMNNIPQARAALDAGIRAAFAKVNAVAAAVPGAVQTVPQISAAAINTYVGTILTEFDGATKVRRLELIMTQKWIASFGFGMDSYTDYRRTGFPVMFDPLTDNDPTTTRANSYPFRFPYRTTDLESNPNAPKQAEVYVEKVFWHNF